MAGRAALLIAALLAAASPSLGAKIYVKDDQDSSTGSCPGSACNLRAAWGAAKLNDEIYLDVNPKMSSSIGAMGPPGFFPASQNGSITITASYSNGAVIHGGSTFLSVNSWPNDAVLVKLYLKNIEFNGFVAHDPVGIICVSPYDDFCSSTGSKRAATQSVSARAEVGATGIKASGELVGETNTIYGNWSQLRKVAVLEVDNCVFRNNSILGMSTQWGCIIAVKPGSVTMPVIIKSSQFMNNTVTGNTPIGQTFCSEGHNDNVGTALMVSDTRVANNIQDTNDVGVIDSLQGPVMGNLGPISMYGCTFVGNSVGPIRAVVAAGQSYAFNYHVYIYESTFIHNVANAQPANDKAAAIIGSWIILHKVNVFLPTSVPPTGTFSSDDQYLHECAFESETGKAVSINGFQMYNRNPLFTNLVNGTTWTNSGSSGFADCSQSSYWLPCRQGTVCSNLVGGPMGDVVGFECN